MSLQLVVLCGLSTLVKGQTELQMLKYNGILFEPMSPALIYQTKSKLITKTTFVDPYEAINFVEYCEKAAGGLCRLIKNKTNDCSNWHQEIYNTIHRIKDQIHNTKFYIAAPRNKRELFDAVGKLSKFLFGTMDSADAQAIYTRLQTLEKNDGENLHLLQKQMTVLKSSFDLASEQFQNLTNHQNHIVNKVNELSTKLGTELVTMKRELTEIHLQSDMNQILLFLLTKLQAIHSHISDQFTVINSLYQHKLHPPLISGKILEKAYSEITDHTEGYIPVNNFFLLNQIIDVQYYQQQEGLIIKIAVPLLLEERYTLNKIYLIPIPHHEAHSTVLDIESNFVLNGTNNQYIELTQHEVREACKQCASTEHIS